LNILFGKGIDRIIGKEKVEAVEISGERKSCDIVVIATGVGPNIEVIKNMDIVTLRGAIMTNQRMETSVDSIYAVGDCCLSFNGFTLESAKINLATTAQKQAIVAGVNAAGGDAIYDGAYGTFVSKIGELEVACTGYNTMSLNRLMYNVVTGRVKKKVKPSWMPNAKDITIKILVDKDTGEILGGQAIGEEGAASRINLIALAIKKRMTIQEFSTIELAYCPAISDLYDPLLVVSDIAMKRYNNVNKHKITEKITSSEKISVTGFSSPP
jgi:NADH oxidase (H2O2-forming)